MKSPFKFLDSYTKEDREIFFGRDKETDELYRRLFESKVLLVYGESGTGKSSLVNCGLINRLRDSEFMPMNIRRGDNILESLSAAIHLLLKESSPRQLLTALLYKKAIREAADDINKQLIFIFDQFEEVFIFGSKEEKQSLVQVLKVLVESDINCRFIFIFREEYFSDIAEFEKHIPDFLSNRIRIEKMDRSSAIAAIKGSCSVNDIQFEEGFAESLLKKLNPDTTGIELTYLQIFLDRIFNIAIRDESGSPTLSFTVDLIEKAGNVSDLLGSFLDDQISLSGSPDKELIILKSFVSYKGTKRLLNLSEVKDYANTLGEAVREKDVTEIIASLVQLRILCDKDENEYYELRHDALAAKIFEKISASEVEILEVRQFIESAYYFWKKHNVLLSEEDLRYIDPFEKRLSLSEELISFLRLSRETFNNKRTRRRKVLLSGSIIIILLLSLFSVWALTERNRAEQLNVKVLAEKYNLLATNVAVLNPTKGLRLAEYAYSLDSSNQTILKNIKRIYSDNPLYTLIARQEEAIAKEEDAINAVAFSPDSKYILTGSGNATVRLWDLEGKQLKIFIGHSGYITSVAFSPGGQSILSASTDRSARLWDIDGKVICDFRGHSMPVNSVAFSPDGNSILTGSSDFTARLWDLKGNVIHIFTGHLSSVNAVAFSPDGQHILTGSSDSTARLWDLKGKQLLILKHLDHINTVAFSPDGLTMITGSSDKTAKLWDLQGKLIRMFTGFPGEVNAIAFSPDGKKIVVGSSAGYTILYDLNGNEIKEFKGHSIQIKAVAFSPDGSKIVTGSGDCTAKLWELKGNLNEVYNGTKARITSVKFLPGGKSFITGSMDKTARLWDIKGNTIVIFSGHTKGINDVSISPDGQKILTGSDDGTAKLWDLQGHLLKTCTGHKSGITSVAFSPDGQKLLTGSLDNTARLWDTDGKELVIFKGHTKGIKSVSFAPDGKSILTGSNDYSARIWDLKGNLVTAVKGQLSSINSVAFSPDGLSFITGGFGSDPSPRLWDLKGRLLKVYNGHTTSIFSAAFSPDGKKILTGSADRTAILWDINGNVDQVFSGYNSYVTSVAFSPDGHRVLIGLDNGTVRLFPVKLPYNEFSIKSEYEKLTSFDNLQYGITDFNSVKNSNDEKILSQASEYYLSEAMQSGTAEKNQFLDRSLELLNKLRKENPEKSEYLYKLLRASVYDYEANHSDQIKKDITRINDKVLTLKSVNDLTLAGYTYCVLCAKNDSSIIRLGITDCFLQICNKLMECKDLPQSERFDISRWCAFLTSDLIQKGKFPEALKAIQTAQKSDSTFIESELFLPILYILNNQYDKAKYILNKNKNKSISGLDFFKTYNEIYNYYIDLLEDRAIVHPDFEKAKELLRN